MTESVVIGAAWSHFKEHSAFRSIPGLSASLQSVCEELTTLEGDFEILPHIFEDCQKQDFLECLRLIAASTSGLVFLYLTSHGFQDDEDRFRLATSKTESEDHLNTSIRPKELMEAVRGSPARGFVILVDCCGAASALQGEDYFIAGKNVCVLTSSKPHVPSNFVMTEGHTAFAAAVIKAIRSLPEGQPLDVIHFARALRALHPEAEGITSGDFGGADLERPTSPAEVKPGVAMRVLIVEDQVAIANKYAEAVDAAGRDFDGVEYVRVLRHDITSATKIIEDHWDVAIFDVFVPPENTLVLMGSLRDANPGCRIIVVTKSAGVSASELDNLLPELVGPSLGVSNLLIKNDEVRLLRRLLREEFAKRDSVLRAVSGLEEVAAAVASRFRTWRDHPRQPSADEVFPEVAAVAARLAYPILGAAEYGDAIGRRFVATTVDAMKSSFVYVLLAPVTSVGPTQRYLVRVGPREEAKREIQRYYNYTRLLSSPYEVCDMLETFLGPRLGGAIYRLPTGSRFVGEGREMGPMGVLPAYFATVPSTQKSSEGRDREQIFTYYRQIGFDREEARLAYGKIVVYLDGNFAEWRSILMPDKSPAGAGNQWDVPFGSDLFGVQWPASLVRGDFVEPGLVLDPGRKASPVVDSRNVRAGPRSIDFAMAMMDRTARRARESNLDKSDLTLGVARLMAGLWSTSHDKVAKAVMECPAQIVPLLDDCLTLRRLMKARFLDSSDGPISDQEFVAVALVEGVRRWSVQISRRPDEIEERVRSAWAGSAMGLSCLVERGSP